MVGFMLCNTDGPGALEAALARAGKVVWAEGRCQEGAKRGPRECPVGMCSLGGSFT